MNAKIKILVIFAITLFSTLLQARVGETYDDIVARFGQPDHTFKDMPFDKVVSVQWDLGRNSLLYYAVFNMDRISIWEWITRKDGNSIPPRQIDTFLNSQDSTFERIGFTRELELGNTSIRLPKPHTVYMNESNTLAAKYDISEERVNILSKEVLKLFDELLNEQSIEF